MLRTPWSAIFFRPKEVLLQMVGASPEQGLWPLSWIYGSFLVVGLAQVWFLGEHVSWLEILLSILIVAPGIGFIYLHILSALVFILGKLVGGDASFRAIRTVLAWAGVPLLFNLAIWLVMIIALRDRALGAPTLSTMSWPGEWIWAMIALLRVVFAVWSFVLKIYGVKLVQQFGAWRGLLSVIGAELVLVLAVSFLFMSYS
jgi:hypothetical protein